MSRFGWSTGDPKERTPTFVSSFPSWALPGRRSQGDRSVVRRGPFLPADGAVAPGRTSPVWNSYTSTPGSKGCRRGGIERSAETEPAARRRRRRRRPATQEDSEAPSSSVTVLRTRTYAAPSGVWCKPFASSPRMTSAGSRSTGQMVLRSSQCTTRSARPKSLHTSLASRLWGAGLRSRIPRFTASRPGYLAMHQRTTSSSWRRQTWVRTTLPSWSSNGLSGRRGSGRRYSASGKTSRCCAMAVDGCCRSTSYSTQTHGDSTATPRHRHGRRRQAASIGSLRGYAVCAAVFQIGQTAAI